LRRSSHDPDNFGEKDIELRTAIDLLCGRERFTFPYLRVQMPVADFPRGAIQVPHSVLEGSAATTVVICHLSECGMPEEGRNVIEYTAIA
jgi:hypothetical protein